MRQGELAERSFEQIQVLRDVASDSTAIIAIHDTRLGPAFGGIRRYQYRAFDDAVDDALRLAESMTWKCALAGIPGGGGKTVLLDHPGLDREAAYQLIGRYVEEMGGRYFTGPDVGTEAQDLEVVAGATGFVARAIDDGPGPLGEPTARGVLAGLAAVAERLGFPELEGCHVVVQGLGEVGRRLAGSLVERGAKVTVADVSSSKVDEARDSLGVEICDPGDASRLACDIFAPCALGGVVHDVSVAALGAKGIAGSANNVLAGPEHGDVLFQRGVLYAPDFVVNAGALIHGATHHLEGETPAPGRIDRIGATIGELLDEAKATGIPPEQLAIERARRLVASSPSQPHLPRRRG